MEEIRKEIFEKLNQFIEQKKEIDELEEKMTNYKKEIENKQKEMETVSKDSGFYKDLESEKKEKEFKRSEISNDKIIKEDKVKEEVKSFKKEVIGRLKDEQKLIDENRKEDLEKYGDIDKLKEEKEKLEEELKLNDVTPEEFAKKTPEEQRKIRTAKEQFLNNKHRLDEITPIINLTDLLDGKKPMEKYIEIGNMIDSVDKELNFENLEKYKENMINADWEKAEEENKEFDSREKEENNNVDEKDDEKDNEEELNSKKEDKEKDNGNNTKKDEERQNSSAQSKNTQPKNRVDNAKYASTKNDIIFSIDENKIDVNGKYRLNYKKETQRQKELMKKYNINKEDFSDNKKAIKNIDFALISIIEQTDKDLVKDYLSVISGKARKDRTLNESIEKLNETFNINYKFDNTPIFKKLKEKRIARKAKELGIASLEGIKDKSFFDVIMDKISNSKLLSGKPKVERLNKGKETIAQKDKNKTIELIRKDRENGLNGIKVENRDNRIEKNALRQEEQEKQQIGKDVQKIVEENNKEEIHKLTSDEVEIIPPKGEER